MVTSYNVDADLQGELYEEKIIEKNSIKLPLFAIPSIENWDWLQSQRAMNVSSEQQQML